jgi:DNA-binding PadR family transcriptional regulator
MKRSETPQDPASFLPLKPDLFQILLAMSEESLHGYGIMKAVKEKTGGAITLEPSPLYRRLKRLLEAGIVAVDPRRFGTDSGGPERQYYCLTRLGRQVLAAEAARVVELAQDNAVRRLAAAAGRVP